MSERFAANSRVLGNSGQQALSKKHVVIVGIGGVGSWAAEALARNGIGELTLIDHDDISISNINRQIHSMDSTLDQAKVDVMHNRIMDINPDCQCNAIDDMLVTKNMSKYLDGKIDFVVDAIDSVRFKTDLIYHCKRNKIPIITTGGAGGLTDPTCIKIADLTLTTNDPLAAKVRHNLRSKYGWSRTKGRRFGIKCVYSTQQPVYPDAGGGVTQSKPGKAGVTLDCESGYGSTSTVTASFGMAAAAYVTNKLANVA